jgi:hypothetical protein
VSGVRRTSDAMCSRADKATHRTKDGDESPQGGVTKEQKSGSGLRPNTSSAEFLATPKVFLCIDAREVCQGKRTPPFPNENAQLTMSQSKTAVR